MKLSPSFSAAFALGLFALAGTAFAGRDGSKDDHSHGPAPAGSETFHPAAPARPEPAFVRPPSPVTEHFRPPEFKEEHHAPPVTGSAGVLPSVNAPSHPRNPTEFRVPAAPVQMPQPAVPRQPFSPPREPQPVHREPLKPNEPAEDFLGMRGEPHNRPNVPTHVAPGLVPPPTTNRSPALTPFNKPSEQVSRFLNTPNQPARAVAPGRPQLPERWRTANNNYTQQFARWSQANAPKLTQFQLDRTARWNQLQQHRTAASWHGQFHTPQYREWRRDSWDYRRARAEEVWEHTRGLHERLFDDQWWSTCWWRHRPWNAVTYVPPWWWCSTPTWTDESAFFGPSLGPAPIDYDPGTNVFYDGDTYDVNGQDQGNAADASQQAISLGTPPVNDIPVPEPAPEGQPQDWLPLGAWALSQQEQGDPVLYFQISVNRDGLVAGGYQNALTGDEQPIVGQVDKSTQRIAWHIANAPQTVFETGLTSLDYDVAGVFVHFGPNQTQNWLLVRLPSPESPPGPARVPPDAN